MKEEKKSSRCVRCGRKTYKNSLYCSECLKKHYLKKYLEEYRDRKKRHIVCISCGSVREVMPFVGLCKMCYFNLRPLREEAKKEVIDEWTTR